MKQLKPFGVYKMCSCFGEQYSSSSKSVAHHPAIPLLYMNPREIKTGAQNNLHTNVHSSITHNSQNSPTDG
jgi:hypothetical protein